MVTDKHVNVGPVVRAVEPVEWDALEIAEKLGPEIPRDGAWKALQQKSEQWVGVRPLHLHNIKQRKLG